MLALFTTAMTNLPPTSTTVATLPQSRVSTPNLTGSPSSNTSRRFKTPAERKALLQKDPWIDSSRVTPKKVHCLGCGSDVKLDMRAGADYYPTAWNKHKVNCVYIKEGRRKADEESGEQSDQNEEAIQPQFTLPVGWTPASLGGAGLTMQSTGDLLRAMGNQGELFWGSRPATHRLS
ncbi:hypothetical protein PM082_018292 [Marasmius tenuissimus]|nr:hypothetical protein PM082_018292 [Marasmius tenuissimus]